MKYNKDVVKGLLSTAFEKQGMSLHSFETALESNDRASLSQHLAVVKEASWMSDALMALKGGGMIAAGLAAGGGALGGLGAYKAYDAMKSTDESLENKKKEQKRIYDANVELQRLHDNPQAA